MYKCSNNDLRNIKSISSTKKLSRCCSFHFRYLELCRAKNLTPLPDIKMKKNSTNILDFYGDKLCVNDWLLVVASLNSDQVLQTLAIRMRKAFPVGEWNKDYIESLYKNKQKRDKFVGVEKKYFGRYIFKIAWMSC
ncbi:protein Cep78 homolog [Stomoxys calcitrans]|uniref:protein Cep78 homolog n=1 Tax=Stomoxys calcitrans TaxID=35570 RepID=UPI0027E36439|nr:protein Cep78 homolog [Stomoxys calcitrans]